MKEYLTMRVYPKDLKYIKSKRKAEDKNLSDSLKRIVKEHRSKKK